MTNPYKYIKNKIVIWWTFRQLEKIAEPPIAKELIRTDKFGNKFYKLKNPSNIPAERALHAWVFSDDIEYSLTRERLQWGMDKLKEAINRQQPDLVTISQVIGAFEAALSLYAEPEVLLNLASVYVTMNNETFDTYADYEQKLKREMWDKDPDSKSFFLQLAYQYSKKYSEQPKLNVPSYLKKIKPVLDQINLNLDPPKKG